MAKIFGIVPRHTLEISLDSFTPEEFLVLALDAAKACDWQIAVVSRSGFRAETGTNPISSGEEIVLQIHGEVADIISQSKGKKLADNKKNKNNLDEFYSVLFKLKENANRAALQLKHAALQPELREAGAELNTQRKAAGFDLLRLFIPIEGYFITPILINVNVLILVLMSLISGASILWPDSSIMIDWGANYKATTLNGQWWRLITANFLHFGIVHLFFNMNALLYIGLILEPLVGRFKFLLAYLLTGITCCLASLWWHDNAVAAGASGSIFGMYGVYFALLTTNFIEKESRNSTLKSIGFFVVYNLVFGAAIGADNAGHVGGLLGGFFLGYCFYFILRHPRLQVLILSLSTAFILGITVLVYNSISNPIGDYLERMEAFYKNESEALAMYDSGRMPTSTEEVTHAIKLWENNIRILEGLNDLDLPARVSKTNSLLMKYCQAHMKFDELNLEVLQHPSSVDSAEFGRYNAEIEHIMEQLQKESRE